MNPGPTVSFGWAGDDGHWVQSLLFALRSDQNGYPNYDPEVDVQEDIAAPDIELGPRDDSDERNGLREYRGTIVPFVGEPFTGRTIALRQPALDVYYSSIVVSLRNGDEVVLDVYQDVEWLIL